MNIFKTLARFLVGTMESKHIKEIEIPDYKLIIAGKLIVSPILNYAPWKLYELPDKMIVFFGIIDGKGPGTDANVVAYDRCANLLWRVEPIPVQVDPGDNIYVGFGWSEKDQFYFLNTFLGESVRLDTETGKITRLGIYFK